jgi:peptidoglycan/LPS O-acetylase OafA/YrhL
MLVLILIIVIIAAITGTLWTVLEIAAGVVLGIFLAAVLLAAAAYLFIRSRFRRFRRDVDRRYRASLE